MMIIIIIKIKRPNGEALEPLRRPTAGQQGVCGGAAPPRYHHPLQQQKQQQQSSYTNPPFKVLMLSYPL